MYPDDEHSFVLAIWELGEVHELRYAGLGTMTNRISDVQAIGSWIRYLGLGTLAKPLVDEQS